MNRRGFLGGVAAALASVALATRLAEGRLPMLVAPPERTPIMVFHNGRLMHDSEFSYEESPGLLLLSPVGGVAAGDEFNFRTGDANHVTEVIVSPGEFWLYGVVVGRPDTWA